MIIGTSPVRVDAIEKAIGTSRFLDDEPIAGVLHAAVAYSPVSHGRLLEVDTSQARKLPGVRAVLTASDVPKEQNIIGAIRPDQPLLVSDRIRWRGDRVAIVAADDLATAYRAAALVQVKCEELPVVHGPEQALEPGAPQLYDEGNLADEMRVRHGDFEAARAQADIVLENRYPVGYQEHAYLEPNAVAALPQPDGGVIIRGSMQCPFYVQKSTARVLAVPLAKVRVQQTTTGGGFGGKEDYPNEPSGCAALLARATGRPVKLVFTREEDLAYSTKRHRMVIHHTLAARNDGTLLGMKVRVMCDAGPYLGLSSIVSERSNASASGPYKVPVLHVDTQVIYTNNGFGGAFRGFGAPQVTFALERQMDLLAQKAGLDPVEIRQLNMLSPGDTSPLGEPIERDIQASRCLKRASGLSRFRARHKSTRRRRKGDPAHLKRGIGLAAMRYGVGLHAGGQHLEGSGALVHVHSDGSLRVTIGGTDIGQGAFTNMAMIAAQTLGIEYERVTVTEVDTALVPDSGPTVASRTTLMSGNAVLDACQHLRKRLLKFAAEQHGKRAADLSIDGGQVLAKDAPVPLMSFDQLAAAAYLAKVHLSHSGWYAPPRKDWDRETGQGIAYSTYAHATMVAEVAVNTLTGKVGVERIYAVHDVGKAIHHDSLITQVQGGVVQGMGWAIMEELIFDEGRMLNPNFTDYIVPTIRDIPDIVIDLIERPYKDGPYGAKGIGEPSLIPVAAAVANAVANALGVHVGELPLSPERVKMTLVERTD